MYGYHPATRACFYNAFLKTFLNLSHLLLHVDCLFLHLLHHVTQVTHSLHSFSPLMLTIEPSKNSIVFFTIGSFSTSSSNPLCFLSCTRPCLPSLLLVILCP